MKRRTVVIGAPSSIGIRPYDSGIPRSLDLAPAALRKLGLVSRLGARDLGDVRPAPYTDFSRTLGRVRNERQLEAYSLAIAERVSEVIAAGDFPLVVGGDCSIVLGTVLGARNATGRRIGLAYVDAHADFATPQESRIPVMMLVAAAIWAVAWWRAPELESALAGA